MTLKSLPLQKSVAKKAKTLAAVLALVALSGSLSACHDLCRKAETADAVVFSAASLSGSGDTGAFCAWAEEHAVKLHEAAVFAGRLCVGVYGKMSMTCGEPSIACGPPWYFPRAGMRTQWRWACDLSTDLTELSRDWPDVCKHSNSWDTIEIIHNIAVDALINGRKLYNQACASDAPSSARLPLVIPDPCQP